MTCEDAGGSEEDEPISYLKRLETDDQSRVNPTLILEALQEVLGQPSETVRFLAVLKSLVTNLSPFLRSKVIEQIPKLAILCDGGNQEIIDSGLLPIVLEAITDPEPQVRKTAQTALLVLIEQEMLSLRTIEEDVCDVVGTLINLGYTNVVGLIGKLAQLLGKEVTIRLFLDTFYDCCIDEVREEMRESGARHFGDICAVLGTEITEFRMMPLFYKLCNDECHTVRKACAEVFMLVACTVSLETRRGELTNQFLRLLEDDEFVVRAMAYLVLGAFIATFSNPALCGLAYDQYGDLIFVGPENFEFRVVAHQFSPARVLWPSSSSDIGILRGGGGGGGGDGPSISVTAPTKEINVDVESDLESEDAYNTFKFWSLPLPDLENTQEEDPIEANLASLDDELTSLSEKLDKCVSSDDSLRDDFESWTYNVSPDSGWNSGDNTPQQTQSTLILRIPATPAVYRPSPVQFTTVKPAQNIVPQPLLDHYLQMAHPTWSHREIELEKDFALHCAYFLPAVVSTLGKDNWPWLAELHRSLALDRQWKVRKTVASSLHALATILGEEITNRDIPPVLKGLLKDLDEVRIGALQNLADLLAIFRPSIRDTFLPLLKDFLSPMERFGSNDADRNWRFREELAEQLYLASVHFSPADCLKYIGPPAFSLLSDKIAAVRKKALGLMARLINLLSSEAVYRIALLDFLYEEFSEHSKWSRRVVFAQLCSEVAAQSALDPELFGRGLLPHLLPLARDPVPNVRLCVARCLCRHLILSGFIPSDSSYFELITNVLETLKKDKDMDVLEAAYDGCQPPACLTVNVTASGDSSVTSSGSSSPMPSPS